jgi:hypothetical protein
MFKKRMSKKGSFAVLALAMIFTGATLVITNPASASTAQTPPTADPTPAAHKTPTTIPPGMVMDLDTGQVAAPAAWAVPACPNNYICFYDYNGANTNWESDLYTLQGCRWLSSSLRNTVSVISNNTNYQYHVYTSDTSPCVQNSGLIYAKTTGYMSSPWNNSIDTYQRMP